MTGGAALLGGLRLGWWHGLEEMVALEDRAKVFEPRMGEVDRHKSRIAWKLGVQRARLATEATA